MEPRLQASSHYCERRKGQPYLPNTMADQNNIRYSEKNIKLIGASAKLYFLLRRVVRYFYHNKLFRNRYCSNNNLGIFITTNCNLSCFNCQTSARQAPANDSMTVRQVEAFVDEAINLQYFWSRIYITGGEPTLHPQFFDILAVLKRYKDFNPECTFILETNGVGNKVRSVLERLPQWISVHNSNKKESKDSYTFFTYTIAPIDTLVYRFFDFSKGCSLLTSCYGLCLSMYGYFPCSPCMNVARVFGFDIGLQKLSLVTEQALRFQLKILCKYCGWFREQQRPTALTEQVSSSWQKAFAEYKKQKPKLTLYNAA
ncbi:MAG: radical SAM protein [Candidatus Omnitrophica bacterium]|nr:radical SAM protein [Candidatus Omnitrophota bacterium]